ncbi:SIR2 family protein [Microbacterium aurugineum]|nr:SIR2 family protein [Microbacterium aurugineum]
MGRLNEISGDIHSRVSARLKVAVTPNDYHRDIWQIATAPGKTPRLVTTNFDLLFETAAAELAIPTAPYVAPTLPLGDDFSDLVHLHGIVDPPPATRMVLTDQDFGRAYITEGWATQFLTRMFAQYTVVLIGYSAEDSIIQYLNRALPAGTRRFAFDKNTSDHELWDRLDITPIPFPSTPGDPYGALGAFLQSWRHRVTATAAERFDAVKQFVEAGVEAAEADGDAVKWMLSDPELARHFRTHAIATEWLRTLDATGVLDDVFTSTADATLETDEWARWVRSSIDHDDGVTLLAVLAAHEGRMHNDLWFQIWNKLYGDFNGTRAHRKLVFVLAAADAERDDGRLSALVPRIADKDPETAEHLLVHLLEPTLRMKVASGWGIWADSLGTRLRLRWKTSLLKDAWPRLFPALRDRGHLLTTILNLIRTVETTDAFFTGHDRPEAISVRRQQVEDAGRSLRDDAYILVVDMGRDLLREAVQDHGVTEAMRLLGDQSEMIRRLAIDALAEARSSEAEGLLNMLIQRGLPFDFRGRSEVFRLIAFAYPNSGDEARAAFIDYIQTASGAPEESEITDYSRYNILVWLSTVAPDDALVRDLRSEYERERGFEPDPAPNLTAGFRLTDPDPSREAEGIFVDLGPDALVAALAHSDELRDEYSNGRVLRELGAYLDRWPSRHLDVLDAMISAAFENEAVWQIVIQDLVRHDVWIADEILDRLRARGENPQQVAARVVFAIAFPNNQLGGPLTNTVERARLLLGLWTLCTHERSDAPATNPAEARSSDRGSLAHHYTETLLRAAEQDGDEARLTDEGTAGLLLLLNGPDDNPADPSPMMVAEYAPHIAYRAPEWFEEHLAPRLAVLDHTPRALTLWAGLLSRGLEARSMRLRFREQIRVGWGRVEGSLPSLVEDYLQTHAVCFAFDSSQEDTEWPDAFLAHARPDVRARWARAVAHYFDRSEPTFQGLLLGHWQHRIDGLPAIAQDEQRAFLRWVTLPGIDVERAAQLFTGGPTVTVQENVFYDYYDLEDFPDEDHPEAYLRVANHLMSGTRFPPPFADQLVDVARTVAPTDPLLARTSLDAILSLGYSPARAVLQELDETR